MTARWKRGRKAARIYHARYRAYRRAKQNQEDWRRWGIEVEIDF